MNTCLVLGSPPDPTKAVIIIHIMMLIDTIMLASVKARIIAPLKIMKDSFLQGKKKSIWLAMSLANWLVVKESKIYFLRSEMTFLNAFSQAYILMTRIPEMISFIIRTRLSVILADFNLEVVTDTSYLVLHHLASKNINLP